MSIPIVDRLELIQVETIALGGFYIARFRPLFACHNHKPGRYELGGIYDALSNQMADSVPGLNSLFGPIHVEA